MRRVLLIWLSMALGGSLTTGCQHKGGGDGDQTPTPNVPGPGGTPTAGNGPFTGNATHFDGLGTPTGGCGVPQANLETQNFVALNVQNTPNDYTTFLARPIVGADSGKIGAFANGRNCGRWVAVTIGDICTGTNDGAPNAGFCHGATGTPWVADSFNGATLNMIVADSCQDGNGWCRDDPAHLDLATASLADFTKNTQTLVALPNNWGNRQISWQYMTAPTDQGDLQIGLSANAQPSWTPVILTHLTNGIHGVDAMVNGQWQAAVMLSDEGQVYVLPTAATSPYKIRVYDAADQLVQNGRTYTFSFPAACGSKCSAPYTAAPYTTN